MDEPESSSFIGAEEEAMHMEKVVAWNVKMLLTARRASQLALAEALGIKKAAMSRKINGYISWSLADVVKAARFLGTTPEDLMAFSHSFMPDVPFAFCCFFITNNIAFPLTKRKSIDTLVVIY